MLGQIGIEREFGLSVARLHFPLIQNDESDFYLLGWGRSALRQPVCLRIPRARHRGRARRLERSNYSDPEFDAKIQSRWRPRRTSEGRDAPNRRDLAAGAGGQGLTDGSQPGPGLCGAGRRQRRRRSPKNQPSMTRSPSTEATSVRVSLPRPAAPPFPAMWLSSLDAPCASRSSLMLVVGNLLHPSAMSANPVDQLVGQEASVADARPCASGWG